MIFFIGCTFLISGAVFLYLLNGFLKPVGHTKKTHMVLFAVVSLGVLVSVWGLYGTLGSPFSPSAYAYKNTSNKNTTNLKVLAAMLEDKCGVAECVSPKNASDYLLLAQTYERLGQTKKSAAVFEKILHYMPDQQDVRRAYKSLKEK